MLGNALSRSTTERGPSGPTFRLIQQLILFAIAFIFLSSSIGIVVYTASIDADQDRGAWLRALVGIIEIAGLAILILFLLSAVLIPARIRTLQVRKRLGVPAWLCDQVPRIGSAGTESTIRGQSTGILVVNKEQIEIWSNSGMPGPHMEFPFRDLRSVELRRNWYFLFGNAPLPPESGVPNNYFIRLVSGLRMRWLIVLQRRNGTECAVSIASRNWLFAGSASRDFMESVAESLRGQIERNPSS